MNQPRTLIISSNRSHSPVPVIPVGACVVASYLEQHGHEVSLLDLSFASNPKKAIAKQIKRSKPDVVGISIRNIDNYDQIRTQHYTPFLGEIAPLVRSLAPKCKVIVGGPAVGFYPEQFLELTDADAVYVGDAESKLVSILEQLLCSNLDSKIINAVGTADLTTKHRARVSKWVDLRRYHRCQVGIPVQTKRGCGKACAHCNSSRVIEGPHVRLRDVDDVVDEIEEIIHKTGSPYIEIIDSILNQPIQPFKKLCQRLIERKVGAALQSTNFWPQGVDPELVSLMEQAGFYSLCVAVESACDKILKELNRGYTYQDVVHTAKLLNNSTISLFWMFILGSPGENRASIQESMDFVDQYVRPKDMVFWNCGLRIHANTAIARRYDIQDDLFNPYFFEPQEISYQEIVDQLEDYCLAHPNSIVSPETEVVPFLFSVMKKIGLSPPFWRYARHLHRMILNPTMRTMRALRLNRQVRRLKA